MLFYAALTVAGVIAAAVVVWVVKSMMEAGKSAYRTLSPKDGRRQTKLAHLNTNLGATPAPWGWAAGNGAPADSAISRAQVGEGPAFKSKSRDWSSTNAYEKSNQAMARQRHEGSPAVTSVRNVLTGYDMTKERKTDTSSWPYQDSFKGAEPSKPTRNTLTEESDDGERPTKPWGW